MTSGWKFFNNSVKKESELGLFPPLKYYFQLNAFVLHIITLPREQDRVLRSNINQMKRQLLIKHEFVLFSYIV